MSLDLARARITLAGEIETLESLLEGEAGWREFRELEARTRTRTPPWPDQGPASELPQELRESLERNPLFLARARLLEALENLAEGESIEDDTAELQGEFQLEYPPEPAAPLSPAERIDAALSALVAEARSLPAPDLTPVTRAQSNGSPTRIPVIDEASDDLRHIAFIDDEVAARLNASGILKFSDIAHLTVEQAKMISVRFGLGSRIYREQWIEQAAVLSNGGSTAYARQVQSAESGTPETHGPIAASPRPDVGPAHPQDVVPPAFPEATQSVQHLNGETHVEPLASVPPGPSSSRVTPPPLPNWPNGSAQQALPPEHYAYGATGHPPQAVDDQVRVVGRSREMRTGPATANPARLAQRRRLREDRSFARNSHRWETVEEAAVEIVPVAPPFPGVGPVQEAARRLQFAAEMPESTLSGILKALRRR